MDENTTSAAPNDDLLRKLALALLVPRYSGESYEEPQLLVGELPPDLPFTLPIPDGARLLGTLLLGKRAATSPVDRTMIVLDTALSGDEVIAFYEAKLPAEGWNAEDLPFRHRGGFMPSGAERPAMANFDRGEQGPSLRFMCLPAPNDRTTVQVTVAEQPAMSVREQRQMMGRDFMRMLPEMPAPAGSEQVQGGGGSSGPDHVDSRATIETDLDVPAVGAHYRTQIQRGGWELRDSGESGPVAWSAWAFTDHEGQPWTGIFTAVRQPGMPRRYHLYVSGDYAGSNEGGASGTIVTGIQTHSSIGWTHYSPARRGGS